MKLLISWSGERSRRLAEALRNWIPGVINAVEPWASSTDIDPGTRWGAELAGELEKTRYGILCVAAENMGSPWLMFEAGALSKYVQRARVVPLLLDVQPAQIEGPLAQFQALTATESQMAKLVIGINKAVIEAGEKGLEESVLQQSFALWWPKLGSAIAEVKSMQSGVEPEPRTNQEMLEETLVLVRDIQRRTSSLLRESRRTQNTRVATQVYDPSLPDAFPANWEADWEPSFLHRPFEHDALEAPDPSSWVATFKTVKPEGKKPTAVKKPK
jgi:hypothetical protein